MNIIAKFKIQSTYYIRQNNDFDIVWRTPLPLGPLALSYVSL